MALSDIDYLEKNNDNCMIEDANGDKQRAVLTVEAQTTQTLSDSKTGTVATTFADDNRVKGYNRVYELITTLTIGDNYFLFNMGPVTGRSVFSLPVKVSAEEGPITFEIYEDGDYSGGTVLSTFNPNRLSSYVHQSILTGGATGTDEGNLLISQTFGAQGGLFESDTPGAGESSQPTIHDTTKNWLLKVTNDTGGALDVNGFFSWFELPNG